MMPYSYVMAFCHTGNSTEINAVFEPNVYNKFIINLLYSFHKQGR